MSRDDTRRYIIAYDVPDDKRRTRLAKALLKHGDRLQYSVFVIDASPARRIRVETEITSIINTNEDSVLCCDLGRLSNINYNIFKYIGQTRHITSNSSIII